MFNKEACQSKQASHIPRRNLNLNMDELDEKHIDQLARKLGIDLPEVEEPLDETSFDILELEDGPIDDLDNQLGYIALDSD